MTTNFDLGLIDGNTWGAVSVDAIEAMINALKDLTNQDLRDTLDVRYSPRGLGIKNQAVQLGDGVVAGGATTLLTVPFFDAFAGHCYKITITFGGTDQIGGGQYEVQIFRGATQLFTSKRSGAAGYAPGASLSIIDVPGAGVPSYTFRTYTNATSGQVRSYYAIFVEDLGIQL